MISLKTAQWETIRKRLQVEYPPSYTLISTITKRELGFTVRKHKDCKRDDSGHYCWTNTVCLDFYDDAKESWFVLKYL
jgi:hypothetical protein